MSLKRLQAHLLSLQPHVLAVVALVGRERVFPAVNGENLMQAVCVVDGFTLSTIYEYVHNPSDNHYRGNPRWARIQRKPCYQHASKQVFMAKF